MLDSYLPLFMYATIAFVIAVSMIAFSFLFAKRPARRTRARTIPFESGVSTGPPPRQKLSVKFYLIAMLFLVFDIEVVFLYTVATMLGEIGWFAVAEFAFFLAMLIVPFVYVWKRGALD